MFRLAARWIGIGISQRPLPALVNASKRRTMVPVPHASSSPLAAPSSGADDPPSGVPNIQAAPVLLQPQADDGIRRFFNAAAGGPAAQPGRMPGVLSQAWSALPPPNTED